MKDHLAELSVVVDTTASGMAVERRSGSGVACVPLRSEPSAGYGEVIANQMRS